MRPLLILSETRHTQSVSEIIQKFAHPVAAERFIQRIDIDVDVENDPCEFHFSIMKVLREKKPSGSQQGYLVCATHDVERLLKLRSFLKTQQVDFEFYNASELSRPLKSGSQIKPQLAARLASCGLSVQTAASSILGPWVHSPIDFETISTWRNQFGRLGHFHWIADAILANATLITAPELGERFITSPLKDAKIAAFNQDERGVKSGEVIANLLTKRLGSLEILRSPADAIERYPTESVVMVEDGLWSGTEAVGVFESLLGRRSERPKTKALTNPGLLKQADLTLVYGVGTDYGQAMVRRYLVDEGLANITIYCGSVVPVATQRLLEQIADPGFNIGALRASGPAYGDLTPHFETCLSSLTPMQQSEALEFCRRIGRQLLESYLNLQIQNKKWNMWSEERLDRSSLGMHGLGLTHAFGHSIPKASLPLLWGHGQVEWKGKVIDWLPLLPNS
ncbi:phosphoribosyltransferase-like protein [Pseudomonas lactucae]|uniref:PRTase-CE domain-containing protein n=1 Tax=Pseudomonas lactucae TaxID=2813360 RepID=A0A9X0YBU2_9PSED|nr:hypothetical protein [Pseudomonas lactucae]MBN2976389.1 hypothetical protein [Pseudomonas lactucae]MBN2987396.1 hypothetical protein [Pseudomonas lactucae]